MKRLTKMILASFLFISCCGVAFASDKNYLPPEDVHKESLAKCKATATDKPTKAILESKVKEAAELLKNEGRAAFPKFHGKDSPFLFCGTYVWIHDLEGFMRTHPIKPKMASGKAMLFLKDKKGNKLFVGMNKIARETGEGWYEYVWPKPGEKEASPKLSYVKLTTTPEGDQLVVGSGVYGSDLVESMK